MKNKKTAMLMVSDMADFVLPFSLLALLNFEIVSAEAGKPQERMKDFVLNLNLSRIRSEYPGRCSSNQNAPF